MLKNTRIPSWVNTVQSILVLIMLGQVFNYYFNLQEALVDSGIPLSGVPVRNLSYTLAGRTLTMALAAIFVLITQNPKQFLVVLFMNMLREGQEMLIDPLFPLADAPASPVMDFGFHVIIVVIEILAFLSVWRIIKREN